MTGELDRPTRAEADYEMAEMMARYAENPPPHRGGDDPWSPPDRPEDDVELWVVGDNMPGYLPDTAEPLPVFDDWHDAWGYLMDEIHGWLEHRNEMAEASREEPVSPFEQDPRTLANAGQSCSIVVGPGRGERVFWIWRAEK